MQVVPPKRHDRRHSLQVLRMDRYLQRRIKQFTLCAFECIFIADCQYFDSFSHFNIFARLVFLSRL